MKLNEMSRTKKELARRALQENFETNLPFDKLDIKATKTMLQRVRGLISETRNSKEYHSRYQNPAYMKAVMMEQALTDHYADLRIQHQIMLENEQVQKGQVFLAAQDMIDSIQKMIVDVSKMKVEELPAVVTGVNNEVGTNEGSQFDSEVQQALSSLEQALSTAKAGLTTALSQITGEGVDMGAMGGDEMGAMGGDDLGGEMPEMPEEEPEDLGGAGRERR